MNTLKTISAIIAVILSVFLYCAKDISTSSDTVSIAPKIIWKTAGVQSIPAGVDSVRITFSSPSLDVNMVKTLPYAAKQGTIVGVPVGISLTIMIEGIDSTGAVAYYGIVEIPTVIGPTMEITIEANQVTPIKPSNLVANELSYDKIRLIWLDNSTNEDYFVIYRSTISDTNFDSISQTTSNTFTDTALLPITQYLYTVRACNQAGYSGPSNSATATTLFLDNTGPTITVESHTDPDTVNKRTITLYGKAKDTSDILQFFVNSVLATFNGDVWMVENFYLPDTLANTIILKAIDNSSFNNTTWDTLTVIYKEDYIDTINHKPLFTISSSELQATIKTGTEYERILSAFDQDTDDSLWFEASAGLTLSLDTIRWTPQLSDTGVNTFYALAKDRKLAQDSISWSITVLDTGGNIPNTPPDFITQVSDLKNSISKNNQYLDTLTAHDIDGDNFSFSKISGPALLTIDSQSGIITWTPTDTGSSNVIARVTDDSAAYDEISWSITVTATVNPQNNPPEFTTTEDDMTDSITLGQVYTDTVVAIDPDTGDNLAYSLINGPVSLDSSTGIVTWTPTTAEQVSIIVRVTDDSSATDDLIWSITVLDTNHAPVFTTKVGDMTDFIKFGQVYKDTVVATDVDSGDNLTYSVVSGPVSVGSSTGIVTWTPVAIGSVSLTVRVTDDSSATDDLIWSITVVDTIVWTTKTPIPSPRRALSSGVVNDKIYLIGGRRDDTILSIVDEYDPSLDKWVLKSPMHTARSKVGVAVVSNKLYAIGGCSSVYFDSVDMYDPSLDTWTPKSSMPTKRDNFAISVVNGKIYVIGGGNTGNINLTTVEEYDPSSDQWTTKSPMPTGRHGITSSAVNGKIYVIGGSDGSNYFNIVEEYDPSSDQWTTKSPMPTSRSCLTSSVVSGKIYVLGGYYFSGAHYYCDIVEEYDPSSDKWITKTSMPTARRHLTSSTVGNKIYAIGGQIYGLPEQLDIIEEYRPYNDSR